MLSTIKLTFSNPIIWVTLFYLLLEMSFAGRLLDVTGGNLTEKDVDNFEFYGRLLSGFALGLAFAPTLINRNFFTKLQLFGKIFSFIILFTITITGMFQIQDFIIDKLKNQMSDGDMRGAIVLAMAPEKLVENSENKDRLVIENLDLTKIGIKEPSTKAFVALFPALLLNDISQNKQFMKFAREMIDLHLKACEIPNKYCVGDFNVFFNNTWISSLKIIESDYHSYKNNKKNHVTPENYFKQKETQEKIIKLIKGEGVINKINYEAPEKYVFEHIYNPIINKRTDEYIALLKGKTSSMIEQPKNADIANKSTERLIIPAVALIFSIIGLLTHIFKLGIIIWESYTNASSTVISKMQFLVVSASAFSIYSLFWAITPFLIPNPLSSNDTYQKIITSLSSSSYSHLFLSHLFDWIIHMEHIIYPLNTYVRHNIFFGFDFGVSG